MEENRDFVVTTDDDETTSELVRVEYIEEGELKNQQQQQQRQQQQQQHHDDEQQHTGKNLEVRVTKEDVYPIDLNSPSNSSEDGQHQPHHHNYNKSNRPGRKTDRQRIEAGQRREWSDTEILQLMQLWRDNDILYNTNHPLYYVQTERKLALDNMASELEISMKDVSDKMHSLRTYYCSQRQRMETLNAEQGGGGESVVSRWKFYDQMSFLYESVTNRAVKSSLNGKSRRKKEFTKTDQPFGYKQEFSKSDQAFAYKQDFAKNDQSFVYAHQEVEKNSPTRMYEAVYAVPYDETMTLVEPADEQPRQRLTTTEYRVPTNDENTSIRYDENSVGKRRLVETPTMYYPIISETNEQPSSGGKSDSGAQREVGTSTKLSSKSDVIFGEMVADSLGQIEDDQQKELLKLNIQTLIYNVRFRKNSAK